MFSFSTFFFVTKIEKKKEEQKINHYCPNICIILHDCIYVINMLPTGEHPSLVKSRAWVSPIVTLKLFFWQIKANRGDNEDVPRLNIMTFYEVLL